MRMIILRKRNRLLLAVVSCAWLTSAAGCAARNSDPVSVAQVAVRANPDLELVATDTQQGVLTVRIKRTARVVTVRADDVVAGTAFRDLDKTDPAPAQPAPAAADPAPAASMAMATAPAMTASAPVAPVSTSAAHAPAASKAAPAATVERAHDVAPAAAVAPQAPRTAPADPPAMAPVAEARSSAAPGANIDESKLKKRTSAVQCTAIQSVDLDGVLIDVDKVAVQALGQCQMRIKNSKLVGRIALQVTGNATVTLENSILKGVVAIQGTGATVISVRSSTITGTVQKLQSANVEDLGQNVWR